MADEGREIVLKLTIDNKEYEARIDVSRKEIIELAKTVGVTEKQLVKSFDEMQKGMNETAASTQKVKEGVEKIKPALEQTGAEGKQFGYNLGQDFDGINVTAQDLAERLDDLKERFKNATIGGEEYNHLAGEIQNVSNHLQRVKGDLIQVGAAKMSTTAQTGAMRVGVTGVTRALMELDPRLGSIVQGFNPLINGFNTASMRGGGFKDTLSAITSQLAGPMGIGIAIGGAGLLVKALTDHIDEINKRAQEAAEKGLKDFERQLSKIGSHNIGDKIRDAKKEIVDLQEKLEKGKTPLTGALTGMELGPKKSSLLGSLDEDAAKTNAEIDVAGKKLEKLTDQEKEINEQKKLRIGNLEVEVDALDKQIKSVENIEGAAVKILELSDKKAVVQKELNLLLETTEERTKRIQQENDKVFDKSKKVLEIAQQHAEAMLSIETGNDYLVGLLKAAHLTQMIELYRKYGKDVTELQLDLNNKAIELDAQANAERKKLLVGIADSKPKEDKPLEDIKRATDDQLKETQINSTADKYEREYALLELWKQKEQAKYSEDAAMKEAIEAQFLTKKNELQKAQADAELQTVAQTLSLVAGMVNENTAVGKALAVSTAIINTYVGASEAIKQGGIFGPALAAAVVLAGMANVAKIVAVEPPKMKGYARGGILEPGKAGFVEGTHKEIIAPEKDFISVVNDLVARSQIAIAGGSYAGGSVGGGNSFIGKIDELNRNIEKLADRPIYITEEAVNKIYDEGDYNARKAIV